MRKTVIDILTRVDRDGAYSNVLLKEAAAKPGLARTLPLIERLVKGALEQRQFLDACLDELLAKPLKSWKPEARNALRLAAYEIIFSHDARPELVVNETVAYLKTKPFSRHLAPVANGVLRNLVRKAPKPEIPGINENPAAHLSLTHSFPVWITKRWIASFGVEVAVELCAAANRGSPLTIRVNTLKSSIDEVESELGAAGLGIERCTFSKESLRITRLPPHIRLDSLPSFINGHFIFQDESASLVSQLLLPKKGWTVVDTCSAPGGKTTHLAMLMGDQGKIYAWDRSEKKLKLVEENCIRLGTTIVQTGTVDAEKPGQSAIADAVLADVPCTGFGVLGRKKDLRWNRKETDFTELERLQRNILQNASSLVKPGGYLVYSTCSIEPAENEDIVNQFLFENPQFSVIDARERLEAEVCTDEGFMRIWPHIHGTDGAFAALMQRSQ
jgi:16S rRNA (cytosine967-C5)-methyltransferase